MTGRGCGLCWRGCIVLRGCVGVVGVVPIGTVAPCVVTVTWVTADREPENTVTVMTLTTGGVAASGVSVDDTGGLGAVSTHALVVVE